MPYIALGLTVEVALQIAGLTRHQYYYKKKKPGKRGRKPDTYTKCHTKGKVIRKSNEEVVKIIKANHEDPDLRYGYKKNDNRVKKQRL